MTAAAERENLAFATEGRPWMMVLRGRWGRAIDRYVTRWTGVSPMCVQYAIAGCGPYVPSLLLTTIGRHTGRLHTVVLPYVVDGDSAIVIGSRGGGPHDPHWAHNIRASGACWICVNRRQVPAVAHVAHGEERQRIFELVCDRKPNVARYQQRAATFGREVPLVVIQARVPVRLSSRA